MSLRSLSACDMPPTDLTSLLGTTTTRLRLMGSSCCPLRHLRRPSEIHLLSSQCLREGGLRIHAAPLASRGRSHRRSALSSRHVGSPPTLGDHGWDLRAAHQLTSTRRPPNRPCDSSADDPAARPVRKDRQNNSAPISWQHSWHKGTCKGSCTDDTASGTCRGVI